MAKQVPERSKPNAGKPSIRKVWSVNGHRLKRHKLLRDLVLIMIAPVLVYLMASLFTYSKDDPGWSQSGSAIVHNIGGKAGAWIADVLFQLCGFVAFLLPVALGVVSWIALFGSDQEEQAEGHLEPALRLVGIVGFLIAATGLFHLHLFQSDVARAGGILGKQVCNSLQAGFGVFGTNLFVLMLLLISVTLATGLSWFALMERIGRVVLAVPPLLQKSKRRADEWQHARALREEREEVRKIDAVQRAKRDPMKIELPPEPIVEKSERAKRDTQIPMFLGVNKRGSDLPSLALLDNPKPQIKGYSDETLEALSRQIELKFKDFRIDVQVVGAYPGPVITRFEIEPARGVKVSQISALDKDIARGLSVKSVRVVEVIPGKSVIGLEIPNVNREMIFLSELLRSKEYDKSPSSLTLALGKNIAGRPTVADLARMPHLLVAGTTGSGKSVAVNAMVLSLLFKASHNDLRMLMIDPKMLELSVYQGIPHLLAPVVTDMKEAANGLRWCVAEMERRYKLMSAVGVRNLAGFNKKVKDAEEAGQPLMDPLFKPNPDLSEVPRPLQKLPFIVIFIDEFADMMMIVGKKVEELIARLAQKARAAGIHLILATQRPSVDVITGLIKANIPTRIAFQVSSKIDSRTILDQSGAETLLGHGDMLYLPPGTAMPERVHGAFVSDDEVHRVVEYLKASAPVQYVDGVLDEIQTMDDGVVIGPAGFPESASGGGDETDPLYDEALRIVTETRRASISSVQRRLRIGYNRAARLIEAMETAGVVSPPEHNGDRAVLAPPPR
ncbi:DNA translocase FtsK 4TM domain-containing protein [Xylella fastidiosa subsp. morus]|uniref:DNA translocase FtsK n=1 Tax=Xylella fastidiosa TaxID=2371 RepID=UPI0003ED0AF0|nr:DNA translocase FtsK [Xylella fastidiosa]AIC12237.1 cell division protein FtsK [Xylella fastidiosa MUL0034]EWG13839.1 cell division protein FtsK/SpoIIIE [Xylella fastidiosa Mul-MD]UIN27451.1 DNA translocase FtsK 4TM domain-containing protein [Xylella fastidiosa subsp. morus]UIT36020.1 DNA translocase FtsK 4TM domain-containing protein [Xylella fastidiosa subsp. morus]UIT38311.1 DNA translocase FtsK 4TM domain-containing protein [Xylella fastidiosa subsp. morus]